jgi:phosphate-selective porin OprO and OprP
MPMKLQDKNKALAAVAVVAFATHPGRTRAEDIAVEIHQLKEEVKQLEPLKARLKQLEAEVAKQKRERKDARGPVRNAAAQPGPGPGIVCKDAPCPPPPPPVFVSFTNGLKVESLDKDFSFRIGGRLYVDGGINSFPAPAFLGTRALPAVGGDFPIKWASVRPACKLKARRSDSGTTSFSMTSQVPPTILL